MYDSLHYVRIRGGKGRVLLNSYAQLYLRLYLFIYDCGCVHPGYYLHLSRDNKLGLIELYCEIYLNVR